MIEGQVTKTCFSNLDFTCEKITPCYYEPPWMNWAAGDDGGGVEVEVRNLEAVYGHGLSSCS